MKYPRIIQLLIRRFKNQLSEQEVQTLDRWMEREENRVMKQDLEKLWEASAHYKNSFQPDVEKGLDRLRHRIRAERKARRRRLWLSAVAAALLLLIGGAYLKVYLSEGAAGMNSVVITTDEQQTVDLPDGSIAHLNEHSRLEYPGQWSADAPYDLFLEGEAFFEVAPRHASGSFGVRTRETETRALGTAFNVRAYPAEKTTEVTVDHGRVQFGKRNAGPSLLLDAKDRGILKSGGDLYRVEDAGINPHPWESGMLRFRNTPMEEVARDLKHYFGVQLAIDNPAIRSCRFTNPAIRKADLDKVLQSIEVVFDAHVDHDAPDSFVVRGGNCSSGQ